MHHPTDYFTAHALFSTYRGKVWGGLSDGPADKRELQDRILDWADEDHIPSLDTLKIYHFQSDVPPRDVTEDFVTQWQSEQPESDPDPMGSAYDLLRDLHEVEAA